MQPSRSWWGVPILVVMAVLLGVGIWAVQGVQPRLGMAWDADVLRHGSATITECRRAPSAAFLSYTCAAEVRWDEDADVLPRSVRPAEPPYRVWSTTDVTGEFSVVSHRRPPATRRGSAHEVLTTDEHPAGTSRGWIGLGYLAMLFIPIAGGVATHRILVAVGIAPERRRGKTSTTQSQEPA